MRVKPSYRDVQSFVKGCWPSVVEKVSLQKAVLLWVSRWLRCTMPGALPQLFPCVLRASWVLPDHQCGHSSV